METAVRLSAFFVALGATVAVASEAYVELTPVPAGFRVRHGKPAAEAVAWGSFDDRIDRTGFGFLQVSTRGDYPDEYQAYAAGLLEGYLTRDLVHAHFENQWASYCRNESAYCQRLYAFLNENLRFMNRQAARYGGEDPYWHQVDLALNQLAGIEDSLKPEARYFPESSYVNATDLLFLNVDGDLEDLEAALHRSRVRKVPGSGSCSALVKVLPGNRDLYFSQVTWSTYSSMLRILKKYSFQYHLTATSDVVVPGHTAAFSSSPGRIFSGDDFYVLSSGLATMETTIGNGNSSLLRYIVPATNLEYVRNVVANRLATSGSQWCDLFARHNSGTYNNQWMVLDYKKFEPGKDLRDDLLWVLEQLPGYVKSADVTDVLRRQSYWPSYNTPYFEEVFNTSGGPQAVAKFGDWFGYNTTPRARIFRRDHSKVHDEPSMIRLMRSNNYTQDPLSACNCTPPYSAENAISARSDLNPPDGVYPFPALGHRAHGSTDMKLTNSSLFRRFEFVAVGGPTYDPLPPFQWSKSGFKDGHRRQPDLWRFAPFIHRWR